ncbi:MAG: Gfo/Idh/MocA family oxidoreductase, partial [Chloroflexia bacterium]|nr:Gfo/Idh/MocA family oxidoreductase [Chloroflexia bacterium]
MVADVFNVGIVGAGTIGQVHARALRSVPNARLVAVAEPRHEAGQELATANDAKWYESFVDMLAHPG